MGPKGAMGLLQEVFKYEWHVPHIYYHFKMVVFATVMNAFRIGFKKLLST
jgi:hypothetical protein